MAAPADESDKLAHIEEGLRARYAALDKFFGLKSSSPDIWEQRAKELIAREFNIAIDHPQWWELTGNFVEFAPADQISNANTRANSEACTEVPFTTEQGIISLETGNSGSERGNFPGQNRNYVRMRFFGTHSGTPSRETPEKSDD